MMKTPFKVNEKFNWHYDFFTYFNDILNNRKNKLSKKDIKISLKSYEYEGWEDFAKRIAWYGRKNGAPTYFKEINLEKEE